MTFGATGAWLGALKRPNNSVPAHSPGTHAIIYVGSGTANERFCCCRGREEGPRSAACPRWGLASHVDHFWCGFPVWGEPRQIAGFHSWSVSDRWQQLVLTEGKDASIRWLANDQRLLKLDLTSPIYHMNSTMRMISNGRMSSVPTVMSVQSSTTSQIVIVENSSINMYEK